MEEGELEAESIKEKRPSSLLRVLVDLRDRQIQKGRVQFGNRLGAIQRGADASDDQQEEVVARYLARFEALEKELDADIRELVKDYPIYAELSSVRGIGPGLAAKLIALIDIREATMVSKLWRFAGFAVINGEREKLVKGEKAHYSGRLKTAMYQVGISFLRSESPYRKVYDEAHAFYLANRPDWARCATCNCPTNECREPELHSLMSFRTPKKGWKTLHIHLAAMRKMEKLFLAHLWERWRLLEGLPIRVPYVQEVLGHTNIRRPNEFGWPG